MGHAAGAAAPLTPTGDIRRFGGVFGGLCGEGHIGGVAANTIAAMPEPQRELRAFNFRRWIDDHRHLLKPPVGNKLVFTDSEFIIMVVGGPNARTDYHEDPGEEFFYQLEGTMTLRTMQDRGRVDIPIHAGEVLLLPPRVPHSPQRYANSVGLVIERQRRPEEQDGFLWYCDHCQYPLYAEYLHVNDIEKQLPPIFERFYGSPQNRTCQACGTVAHKR
jgi:3-hydroxyanthranilate 3,4-dioxygenase